jgi:hypothetical protein
VLQWLCRVCLVEVLQLLQRCVSLDLPLVHIPASSFSSVCWDLQASFSTLSLALLFIHHQWCPGQVLCFPRPADVPGAAHGPAEHGGLHWPDSAGLAYEVSTAVSMCLCELLQSVGILGSGKPIHHQSHPILGLKLRPDDLAQQGQHASNIRIE